MKTRLFKISTWVLRIIMVLFAVLFIIEGIVTMFDPLTPVAELGWLYANRIGLVIAGGIIAASGAALLYGKIRQKDKWVRGGLKAIFYCYTFAGFLNWYAIPAPFLSSLVLGNFIGAAIVAALYLWWLFKTNYISKHSIYQDVLRENPELRY